MKKLFIYVIIILLSYTLMSRADTFEFINPTRKSIWIEGKTYTIKWKTDIKGRVCLTILIGGKDKGIINECKTDASIKHFSVKIPIGFVSWFGIPASDVCRVAACFENNSKENCYYSDFFTITEFLPPKFTKCKMAIKGFFNFINHSHYKKAYSLLSFADLTITNCDGEKIHFPSAQSSIQSFQNFQKRYSNKKFYIQQINDLTGSDVICNGLNTLGIKLFSVKLKILNKNNDIKNKTLYFYISKDTQNNCRIINISQSP